MDEAGIIRLQLIKLVSWDMDGTLYSIQRMKWHLLGMFLREVRMGRGRAARRELIALRGYRATIDVTRSAGGALEETLQTKDSRELLLTIEKRWYGPAIRKSGTRTGVTNLLSFLSSRNVPQVVSSDYEAEYKLESLGLNDRFASIYVGERLGFVKPNPTVHQRIAADFEIPTASLLHIGDRADRDEAAALAAGCQCLILGRDFRSFGSLLAQLRAESPTVREGSC